MARDYTAELLPAPESFEFLEAYQDRSRTVLIAVQALLKPAFPAGAGTVGLVIEYLDRISR